MIANKKGAMWIAYILAVLFFTAIAILTINWGKSLTEESTESTINYVSGRMDCQQIKFAAESNELCNQLNLINKGELNIYKILIRSSDATINEEALNVNVGNPPLPVIKTLNFYGKTLNLLPVIESSGELFGCKDKELILTCP
ncbi:MAG: hypothetical protein U9Q69_02770 [Nanoarchaeota archaeon]|nr:hypothetical protein [Nanoarchaeota archaeon]